MTDKSLHYLLKIQEMQARLEESEQLIEAIKAGEVDAFAIKNDEKQEVFTLQSGDYAYRVLIEELSEGAVNITEEGLIVYVNPYLCELLGMPYEKIIGTYIFNFIYTESKEKFEKLFGEALKGKSKGEINLSVNGSSYPVYISLTSLQPKLATVGILITDLGEKKKFEVTVAAKNTELLNANKELERINKNLQRSEERYHRMIAEVQDYAIILLNNDGVVMNWNKGAERIKGYTSDEIVGEYFSVFYTAEDRTNHIPEKLLAKAKETGKATDENYRVRKDGTKFWGSVVITALHDNDNNVVGYVKVTRDLTERKIAEEEIKTKAQQLELKNIELVKMNKELDSFAYVSSHDLKEPLRKIQTFATRILEKDFDHLSENGRDYFTRMQNAANRMQSLIDDLLSYSRTNTSERKFEKTDLNKIIEEIRDDFREEIASKHATIATSGLGTMGLIPFQFRQLMSNLIGNSLKFSNPTRPPHIFIEGKTETGRDINNRDLSPDKIYCHISVADNGIGFEQRYSEKIFQVFQRLHGRSEYSGTGIGLSIVKKIVENHNGIIKASSVPDKGTVFDIYIPE